MTFTYAQSSPDAGIEISNDCIANGTCKLQIYRTLQIRQDTEGQNSPQQFVQDVFLAATFFIGTMATISLLVSGMFMAFGGADEGMYEKGKKGFTWSIIGLLLVILSYILIRIVQYIAQGTQ